MKKDSKKMLEYMHAYQNLLIQAIYLESVLIYLIACVDRGRRSSFGSWNSLNIRIIYDKFIIRIIIIVVKVHK